MKIDVEKLKFKFKLKDDPDDLIATMILIIGQFEIRGFRVMKSKFTENKERFVLFPPANKTGNGKWIKIFFTENRNDWLLLEKRALEQFDREHTEYLEELYKMPSNSDIEKVEF